MQGQIEFGLAVLGAILAVLAFFRLDYLTVGALIRRATGAEEAPLPPPTAREKWMLGFGLFSFLMACAGFWGLAHQPEPPPVKYLESYGNSRSSSGLYGALTVDTSKLQDKAKAYRLVGVAMRWNGTSDQMDWKPIEKSGPYDISTDQSQFIFIQDDAGFLSGNGTLVEQFFLLLVPRNIQPDQFSTLREAENLGAQILDSGTATWVSHRILSPVPLPTY